MQGARRLMGFLVPALHCTSRATWRRPWRATWRRTWRRTWRNSGRAAGLLVAGLAAWIAAPPVACAQTAIRFTLDGPIEGPEGLFLFPQDKGYFKAEGLDVVIDDAVLAMDAVLRVASGGYDLGLADINTVIRYRDQHAPTPLKPIFMVYNKPPYAVVARKSRGVTEPKQLEGKRLGAPTTGSSFMQWPLFAKLSGIDAAKVTIENIGIPVRAPMLAAGQIDAAIGASFRLYIDLKDRGVPLDDIVLMPMPNFGMRLYGAAIIVNAKFAAEKPQAVRSFLHAFTKGLKEGIRHPAGAVESVIRRNDAARPEVELERLRMAIRDNIVTPEVKAEGLGSVELTRMAQALDQLALVYTFKSRPKPEDVLDQSFLPPLAERKIN
jgi:NitT/TauT family transport system substrate-binding protein